MILKSFEYMVSEVTGIVMAGLMTPSNILHRIFMTLNP